MTAARSVDHSRTSEVVVSLGLINKRAVLDRECAGVVIDDTAIREPSSGSLTLPAIAGFQSY